MTRFLVLFTAVLAFAVQASDFSDVRNYIEYDDTLSSAGQPDAKQLARFKDAGFDRIVNITFTTDDEPAEDAIARELGLQYVQIPVIWSAPTVQDFRVFAAVMQSSPDARTLVHCQANYRAVVFSFLYRVAIRGDDFEEARRDMESVWEPNETWTDLINSTLAAYGIDKSYP